MIRTIHLTGSISRNAGGLYDSVRRLVQSLADTGVAVKVLGVADEFTAKDVRAWHPVEVIAFPPFWPREFGYSPGFANALREFSPDITHTHGIWLYPSMATNRYCHPRSVPYMISPQGMLDPWAMRNSRWKKVAARFLYEGSHLRGAACLRALCESEVRAMRQFGLTNPIAVIPNGIDVPEIGNQKAENRNLPWAGYVEPGRKVLLFLSRIHPKKGLVNLLRAWKTTLNSQPSTRNSWVLAIAGWDQGGHEAELKQLATELGIPWADVREKPQSNSILASSILFLGPQFNEAKAACIRTCDAFILPSFSEGMPMAVLETWACGKPVLMTQECNLPEGFAAGAAIPIDPSAESVARGLNVLFQSSASDLQSTGWRGRALAAERFAWSKIATDLKSVKEWLLGGGPKPECVQTKS